MVDRHDSNKTFQDFYLSEELLQALTAIGYTRPTPVQASSIPLTMAGIDLIVQSQTGTGKTAAFGIPVVDMLEPDPGTIEVLVLAPTRELAKQVSDEFTRLTQYRPITSTAIYGGTAYGPQIEALKTAQVVCATPGRLLDLLKQKEMTLEHLRFFILDEADEMLSMGFERDLRAVLDYLPEERQSLLFSATVTEDVRALAGKMLFYPEYLSFSSDSVVNQDVAHSYFRVSGISRMRDLIKVIEFEEPDNAIIFANTKDDTFLVNNYLQRHGYAAEVLNGDLAQKDREKTLSKLRNKEINFLVATDVAARGIDITDLSHVINFVLPDSPEVYVHRTGRTGRAGNKGIAISLVSPGEMTSFILTRKRVDMEIAARDLPTTHDIIDAKRARRAGDVLDRVAKFDALDHQAFMEHAQSVLEGEDAATQIATLLAIASKALDSKGKLRQARPAAPKKARPAPVTAPEPEASAPVAEDAPRKERPKKQEPEVVAEPEEVVEADAPEETQDEKPRGRRRSRRPRRDDAPRSDAPEETQDEDVHEAKPRREKKQEDDAPAKEERRGSSRRRRSSRDSNGRDNSSRDNGGRDSGNRDSSRGNSRGNSRNGGGRDEQSSRSNNKSSSPSRTSRKPAAAPAAASHDMSRMWLSFGKNVFKKSDEVLEFLVYNSGMDEEDFGEIRIERAHTFVDVRREYIQDVIGAINDIDIEGNTLTAKPARR